MLLKEKNEPKVIVVAKRLDIEYWKTFESGANKAFRDFDINGKVIAPDSFYPINNQTDMLKNVLNEQPDALVVAPIDSSVTMPVLMEYKKKDIPVIFASRDIEWEYKTAYIGTNHHALGKKAGMLLGSMLQPGDQVAIIFGREDDQAMIDRKNGAKKMLEDIGVEVVTEQPGYDRFGNPKPVAEKILQAYPNLKGIVASDRLISDALKAIDKKGINIPVVGTDGLIKTTEFVKSGKIRATIAQNPYDMGYLSVERAKKAIEGVRSEKSIDSGVDIIIEDNAEQRVQFLKKVLQE